MRAVASRISSSTVRTVVQRAGQIRQEAADDAWGRSESFDPDNVGDIADEGAGHRG